MRQMTGYSLHNWLLFTLLAIASWQACAQSRVLDRIEVRSEADTNVIAVHFNVPVRYVSHVANDANNEIGLQLQIIKTPEIDLADLLSHDQLSWIPSQEIPLSKVAYQGSGLGTSSLLLSFATLVLDFRIRQSRDFYVMEFILNKQKKLPQVEVELAPLVDLDVPETRSPLSSRSLPLVNYVINLSSESGPIDQSTIAPLQVAENLALYTTKVRVDGRERHHLRIGFFRTHEEAEKTLKEVKRFYPKARIDRADIQERRQALFESGLLPESEMGDEPLDPGAEVVTGVVTAGGVAGPVAEGAVQSPAASVAIDAEAQTEAEAARPILPADERLTKMMELIRRAMTAGEYDKAIRMLEGFLEEPENEYTKEAMELLGLARERNGQSAHAKAEYEAFLQKYPEGEDAERVHQRLLGLSTAPKAPKESVRDLQEEEKDAVEWENFGNLSQYYRRTEVDNEGDENDAVSHSEIETFVDLRARRRSQSFDINMKLAGSQTTDLLNDGEGNDEALSYAYIDVQHLDSRSNLRLGRQKLRSSGILNSFDGLVLGYELTPDINLRGYAGLPVERTRDVFLHEHKQFMGIGGDIANLFENWDVSLYLIDQKVDDLTDRQALGGELRYFGDEKSLSGLLDYDVHYGALNFFVLQGNWTLADKTRLYMSLDYRKVPLLLTSNAIRGYNDPDLFSQQEIEPVESIEEMLLFESADYIYTRAEKLSGNLRSIQMGVSRPFSSSLTISGDLTISNTKGTPQLGTIDEDGTITSNDGVEAVEDTGNEYFYNVQLIKSDLLKQGDIGTLSMRYYDTSTSDTLRIGVSSRYPITNLWRINPRLDVAYRKRSEDDDTRLTVSPYLRMDYRMRRNFTLEFEGGASWYKDEADSETTKTIDYFFIGGYRWDF
jgi:tetratricopeptide (TPR) repeat protein